MIVTVTGAVPAGDVDVDARDVLDSVPVQWIIDYIEKSAKGKFLTDEDASNYINLEKSVGTEAFYDLLVNAIDEEKLSLEMIIGKVMMKKYAKDTVAKIADKP